MQFFSSAIVGATIFGLLASAVPLEARQDELQPFQVTAVASQSPPGRPGSSPWSWIRANVTDPNSYFLSQGPQWNVTVPAGSQGINCEARWYKGENPLARTWPCEGVQDGHWAMQVLAGKTGPSNSVSDFKLRFIHGVEPGSIYGNTRIEAEAFFVSQENLNGRCSSGGVCSYSLKPDAKPTLAPAKKTS